MGKSLREKCPRSSHAVWKAPAQPPGSAAVAGAVKQGADSRADPHSLRAHGADAVYLLSRGGAQHGGRPGGHADNRPARAGVRRLPSAQLRRVCHARTTASFSTSTTWMRRSPRPGSGTSSAWPQASSWPAATTASAKATPAMRCWRVCARIGNAWRNTARCRCWTCGMPASTSKKCSRRSRTRRPASGSRNGLATARARSVLEHDFPKLAAIAGQAPTIKDNPPLIYHLSGEGEEDLLTRAQAAFAGYRESLQEDRRVLIDRYELKDIAIKVVGVGSVGTFCAVDAPDGQRTGSPVPPGQRGAPLGAGGVCRQEHLPESWAAGRERLPAHAIGERHLPRLDEGQARPAFLRPPAQGHEDRALWSTCSLRA